MKLCRGCGLEKEEEEFSRDRRRPSGRRDRCKTCASITRRAWYAEHPELQKKNREAAKAWREANPEARKEESKRRREAHRDKIDSQARFRKYGVTQDQYDAMLASQSGACALCRKPPKANKRLGVDHDHATGVVRGLLCDPCNQGIGMLGDNAVGVAAALLYLLLAERTAITDELQAV